MAKSPATVNEIQNNMKSTNLNEKTNQNQQNDSNMGLSNKKDE